MKFGLRKPSVAKSVSARLSPARAIRHSLGVKAPSGLGLVFAPRRASYNFFHARTSFPLKGAISLIPGAIILYPVLLAIGWIIKNWDGIIIAFYFLTLMFLIGYWIAIRLDRRLQNEAANSREERRAPAKEDYTRWSAEQWKKWRDEHEILISSGRKRTRPESISEWTPDEKLDWEKEEWLRISTT